MSTKLDPKTIIRFFLIGAMIFFQSQKSIAQNQIDIDNNIDCIEYPEFDKEVVSPFAERDKYANLEIQWVVEVDSILDFDLKEVNQIYDEYLYHPVLNRAIINVTNGDILQFGHPIFKEWFEEEDMFIQYLSKSKDTLVAYSPTTGRQILKVKGFKPLEFWIYEFAKDLFFMEKGGKFGNERYLINAESGELIWKNTATFPIYYSNIQKFENYIFYNWQYRNYQIDSSLTILKVEDLKTGEIVAEYKNEDGAHSSYSLYDNFVIEKEGVKSIINTDSWEVDYCIKEYGGNYIKDGEKRIYSNRVVNNKTGKYKDFGRYDMFINAKWKEQLIYRAVDSDGNEFYMMTNEEQEYLHELFITFKKGLGAEKIDCPIRDIYYGLHGKIEFINSSYDSTIAYFQCNGKTYFIGVKIIERDLDVDAALKKRGY